MPVVNRHFKSFYISYYISEFKEYVLCKIVIKIRLKRSKFYSSHNFWSQAGQIIECTIICYDSIFNVVHSLSAFIYNKHTFFY